MTLFLWVVGAVVVFLILVGIYDVFIQSKHAVMHNYPIIGHMRYILEKIGPEMRQYWVAHDKEEMPFDRTERSWIYTTAKGINNYQGFGSRELHYSIGYPIIKQSSFPYPEENASWPGDDPSAIPVVKIIGAMHGRKRPWRPQSIVNISGMS